MRSETKVERRAGRAARHVVSWLTMITAAWVLPALGCSDGEGSRDAGEARPNPRPSDAVDSDRADDAESPPERQSTGEMNPRAGSGGRAGGGDRTEPRPPSASGSDAGRAEEPSKDAGSADASAASGAAAEPPTPSCTAPATPVTGSFHNIYDPSVAEMWPWYINDHTIVQGPDGLWHMFGITHAEPANPENETELAHATSSSLIEPNWQKQEPALRADASHGETVLWAPFVMLHDGLYYMFYCGGGVDRTGFQIALATSTDLRDWTREPEPLFNDGYGARDPFVFKVGDRWVMYYTATSDPGGGAHVVAYRTSSDLRSWGPRQFAYVDRQVGSEGGNTESPFVVQRDQDYYLLIGPRDRYSATTVLHSRDPLHFADPQIAELPAHAPEVVTDLDGKQYISRAGWGEGGLWLAPLEWPASRCELQETGAHRLELRTEPSTGLASLRVASTQRELLGVGFDVPGPYLVASNSPQAIKPSAPKQIERSVDGTRVVLRGMRMGDQPVEVDWAVCTTDDGFDHRFVWRVLSDTSIEQAGWSLSLSIGAVGDETGPELSGARLGFGSYSLASDEAGAVAVAYREDSAFAADSRSYGRGFVGYRNLAEAGSRSWSAGEYQGGLYRVAVSASTESEPFATTTASALSAAGDACPL